MVWDGFKSAKNGIFVKRSSVVLCCYIQREENKYGEKLPKH